MPYSGPLYALPLHNYPPPSWCTFNWCNYFEAQDLGAQAQNKQ